MFLKAAALVWGFSGALGVQAICPINSTDYTVTNQTDADALNLCQSLNGTLRVIAQSHTSLISIPGLKNITGDLYIGGSEPSRDSTSMSTFSMQSLQFVGGGLSVESVPNLGTLDFPALGSVAQALRIFENPSLSTVSLPNLTSIGSLELYDLPSLVDLNFVAGIRNITGFTFRGLKVDSLNWPPQVKIQKTGLVSLEGLLFHSVGGLTISENALENFTLSLKSIKCAKNVDHIFQIYQNHNMSLNLPNLITADCEAIELDDLYKINIPALSTVIGSLFLDNLEQDTFNAPKLLSVSDVLHFEGGAVQQINLPALQTANSFTVINLPAVYHEDGISLPNVKNISTMSITGANDSQPYCQILDNQRCRGLFTGQYHCGNFVAVDSDPNNCQYTYPAYGWTRSQKLEAGLGISLGSLVLLGLVWLVHHNIKFQRAQKAATQAVNSLELAPTEQLPKYSQHDYDRGSIPPCETRSSSNLSQEGESRGESDLGDVSTLEEGGVEVVGSKLDVLHYKYAESVPISPLEETYDSIQHTIVDKGHQV